MEVTGTVKLVGETQTFGTNGFRKRELVITTEEQYPQDIMIEFVQDKCDLLNSVAIGSSATVGINLRGREWLDPKTNTNKYFNSIQGWKISKPQTATSSAAKTEPEGHKEDLPF
jgi:hypothetical protein